MKTIRVLKLAVLILILAQPLFSISIYSANAGSDIIYVPDDYPTIQYAIGNATDGDTIIVDSGTYNESIAVNKRLTIQGADKATTFIDGMMSGDVVLICADDVQFFEFTLLNASGSGIYLNCVNGTLIYECVIHDCSYEGIYANSSGYTSIENCTIYDNGDNGLYLYNSHGARIDGCDIYNNSENGILVILSNDVWIKECSLHENDEQGIYLSDSDSTWTLNCTIYDNHGYYAIFLYGSDLARIVDSDIQWNGICLQSSDRALIIGCDIHDVDNGILLYGSDGARILDCIICNSSYYGIYIYYSDHSSIINCKSFNNSNGISLCGSNIVSICNNTFHNNEYGLTSYTSNRFYASKSVFLNNSQDGLWLGESTGTIANCNVTGNEYNGIYTYKSEEIIRYCSIEDNDAYGLYSELSTVNATENWWGDASGPYHPSMNPIGAGDNVSDDVVFDPWQTELYQPDVLISDLRCQLEEFDWRVVYPDQVTPKPLGCSAAWVSDWLASAFVTTKLEDYVEGLDTNAVFVDPSTGKAVGDAGTCILTFGGRFVNPVVKHAESDGTPDADRAPVKFHMDGGIFRFQYKNGTNIPGAWLPQSVINVDEDLFVIERYLDGDGRYMMICYGFGWPGTYAAGKFFDNVVFQRLGTFTDGWVIVHWEDTNGDGFVNNPGEGDTYTPIARGS